MSKLGPVTVEDRQPEKPARASFFGTYNHKVSGRNQVALPRTFLRSLERSDEGPLLLLRWNDEGFLRIFTQEQLDKRIDQIRDNPKLDSETKGTLIRRLAGGAEQIEPDRQGRFVLPGKWVEALGLRDEVVFSGAQTRIEIWPAPAREDQEEKEKEQVAAVAEQVTEMLDL